MTRNILNLTRILLVYPNIYVNTQVRHLINKILTNRYEDNLRQEQYRAISLYMETVDINSECATVDINNKRIIE